METEKKFITKTGFCHILPDKIILTRDGIIGNVAKTIVGNEINRILLIYSGTSIFLIYSAYTSFKNNEQLSAIFFSAVALYLIYNIFRSINNSATPIIERNKIKEVKFYNGKVGLTRSRFEIKFEDENGKLKNRLIMLPGSLNDGKKETENALEIMKNEKLIA
jgi:hypothetical protein